MRRLLLVFLFSLLISTYSFSSHGAARTEIILDVSGSMNAKTAAGETRMEAARKAIAAAVNSIPEGSVVALRLYSHRVPQTDKAASCKDTQLVVPFGPINKSQIINTVNQAMPLGQTPIAYSLEQAALDFASGIDEQQTIILVSDGEESCGGDPVAVAKALVAKGFKIKIDGIGLDVDAAAKNQLSSIASATGGQYFDARDASSLTSSLQKLTQDSLLIKKEQAQYGEPIRGGNSYETAVPLQPGKLYRLDHHQRINQFDYFYVDAKAGQKISAFTETGENGVSIQGDQATPNTNPYGGIGLHNPTRQQIEKQEIIGTRNSRKNISYGVPGGGDGRYYILIGSTYDNQNKDNRFQVDFASQFDANTNLDAPDNDAAALEIAVGNYEKNYLSEADSIDVFKLNLAPGTYEIKARPTVTVSSGSSLEGILQIEAYDADGVKLAEGKSPNIGAVAKIDALSVTKPGPIFIRVKDYWKAKAETTYSLSITAVGAVAGAESQPSVPPAVVPSPAPSAPSPAPVPTPAAPLVKGPVFPGGPNIAEGLKQLTFLEKAKWVSLYILLPWFAVFLIGLIFGYVWGRKSGKRKALAQMQKGK